jgi:hypothetical protein
MAKLNKLPHAYVVPPGTVVIHGPDSSEKFLHAHALARHYGRRRVINHWQVGTPVPIDAIALTTDSHLINAISLKNAMRAAGLARGGAA